MPPARQQPDRAEPRADVEVPCSPARRAGRWRPASTCGRAGRRTSAPAARATRAWRSSWASSVPAARARAGRPARRARARARRARAGAGRGERARRRRVGTVSGAGRRPGRRATSSRSRCPICSRRVRRAARSSTSGRTTGAGPGESCSISAIARTPSMDRFPAYHRVCRLRAPRILPLRPMPRNDPTDTGGLFIGRRPGTAPLRYKADPERGRRAAPPDRRAAGRRGARARGAGVPDAVGPAAASRGCGSARRSTTTAARSPWRSR